MVRQRSVPVIPAKVTRFQVIIMTLKSEVNIVALLFAITSFLLFFTYSRGVAYAITTSPPATILPASPKRIPLDEAESSGNAPWLGIPANIAFRGDPNPDPNSSGVNINIGIGIGIGIGITSKTLPKCNPRSLRCGCLKAWNITTTSACNGGGDAFTLTTDTRTATTTKDTIVTTTTIKTRTTTPPLLPHFVLKVDGSWAWAAAAAAAAAESSDGNNGDTDDAAGPRGGLYACRRATCDVILTSDGKSTPRMPDIQLFTSAVPSSGNNKFTRYENHFELSAPMFLMEGASPSLHGESKERLFFSGFFSEIDDGRFTNVSDLSLAPTFESPAAFQEHGLPLEKRDANNFIIALARPPWSAPELPPPHFGDWGVNELGATFEAAAAITASPACTKDRNRRACLLQRARFLLIPADGGAAAAVYEALAAGVVPVMPRGGAPGPLADLPRSAAVWADDFATPEALRASLTNTGASHDTFATFFTWKAAPLPAPFLARLESSYANAFCAACDLAAAEASEILPVRGPVGNPTGGEAGTARLPRCVAQRLRDAPSIERDWAPTPAGGILNQSVYVIARSDSPRLPAFRRRLAAAGLGGHLVIGFDRANMSVDDMNCWAADSPIDSRTKFGPSGAEIANGAATYAALWDIYKTGNAGMIIEDDVVFLDGWRENYRRVMEQLNFIPLEDTKYAQKLTSGNWDAVWMSSFEGKHPGGETPKMIDPPVWYAARHGVNESMERFNIIQQHGSRGCSAYIVTARGARKLLNDMPLRFPFDHQFNKQFENSNWITVLHTLPPLITEAVWVKGFVMNASDGWASLLGEDRKRRPDRRLRGKKVRR